MKMFLTITAAIVAAVLVLATLLLIFTGTLTVAGEAIFYRLWPASVMVGGSSEDGRIWCFAQQGDLRKSCYGFVASCRAYPNDPICIRGRELKGIIP